MDLLKIETNNQINLIFWRLVPFGSYCWAWPRRLHRTLASSEIPHALIWSSSLPPTQTVLHLQIGWIRAMVTLEYLRNKCCCRLASLRQWRSLRMDSALSKGLKACCRYIRPESSDIYVQFVDHFFGDCGRIEVDCAVVVEVEDWLCFLDKRNSTILRLPCWS